MKFDLSEMWISARDLARFGLLTLRNGKWKGKQLMGEEWIREARTPTRVQTDYGFMNWYLNTGRKKWPSAPESAFAHIGNGTNIVYCDAEHDVVAVLRWIVSVRPSPWFPDFRESVWLKE